MLSLEIFEKMSKFFFSRLAFILDFIYIWIKGDSTTLDALIPFSEFWQAQVYQEMLRFSCTL
jgi:hypothetical protein